MTRSLQKTLTELREYQQKHDVWHQQQQKLISEQSRLEEKIEQRLFYDAHQMNMADKGVGKLVWFEDPLQWSLRDFCNSYISLSIGRIIIVALKN